MKYLNSRLAMEFMASLIFLNTVCYRSVGMEKNTKNIEQIYSPRVLTPWSCPAALNFILKPDELEEFCTIFNNLENLKKTEFDVILSEVGNNKLKVYDVLIKIFGLSNKEAVYLVSGAKKILKKGVSKESAERLKAELEAVGAKVQIKNKI